MRLPDFEAWAVFAAVADTGSFTAAADALSLSKAKVSKAVSRLEAELGTVLFHRTSRRLSLSAAGRSLVDHARRIRIDGEAAVEAARDEASLLTGTVRIALPMSFGLRAVAPLIARFMAMHPGIIIDMHLSDARVDLVSEGFDLALRIATLPDSSLRAIRLRPVQLYMIASPDYCARHGTPVTPQDLGQHRAVYYANAAQPGMWALTGPDGTRLYCPVKPALIVNNADAAIPAVLAGLCIAALPDFFCDEAIADGRLVRLMPEWQFDETTLSIVTPPSPHRPARVEALIAFLRSELPRN
ncbi:LysR family transcriptional regulator [Blastomonas aquatica]|uniref:Transcriptional regulator n=1 Tax=Blastomonas aquatica TaxID=1510276 RepID=A0ABQ1JP97_9SPHN|nr:LysR family transcriptional regulator [Blastomonas aquatica]GGB71406.1 transcriptional regulator [Blastomonas aquatica]